MAVEELGTGKMLVGIQYVAVEVDMHPLGYLTDCLAATYQEVGQNLKKYNQILVNIICLLAPACACANNPR